MNAKEFLSRPVNFGGITVSLGEAIDAMRSEGASEALVQRWVQGALLQR